ncbi:hypothetical protein [Sinorhizobium meliloti]|nr:hypothetical protein [Sinorhizobium meliloti]
MKRASLPTFGLAMDLDVTGNVAIARHFAATMPSSAPADEAQATAQRDV